MKIRMDFVTNSSSSSYVIAYKKVDDSAVKTLPEPIQKMYEVFTRYFFGNSISNEKELQEYFSEVYGYDSLEEMEEDDWAKQEYEEYLSKIKQGYSIAFLEAAYGEETIPAILQELEDGENFIILEFDE